MEDKHEMMRGILHSGREFKGLNFEERPFSCFRARLNSRVGGRGYLFQEFFNRVSGFVDTFFLLLQLRFVCE